MSDFDAISWRDNDAAPWFDPDALAALLRLPRFEAAMLSAASATVELYRGHWVLNRLLNDRGRLTLGLMILDLHYSERGGAGFTSARLQQDAIAHGVCSPGRTAALLASLRLLGLLKQVADEDRRLRRLVPTERFIALHRERWQRQFGALALLCPEGDLGLAALSNADFIGAFAHVLVSAYRGGLRLTDQMPALRSTADRDGGLGMIFSLVVAEVTGQPVSIAALARRFSVSRAHVLTVLREAERVGLAALSHTGGGYRGGPALMPTMRQFFATMFLIHQHAITTACRMRIER